MLAWWAVVGVTSLLGAEPAAGVQSETRLGPEQFVLMAWNRVQADQPTLARMRDCGFNLAGFARSEQLNTIAAAGLQCFVYDPKYPVRPEQPLDAAAVTRAAEGLARQYRGHPAVYGYFLADEPHARHFATLGAWAGALREASPSQVPYVSLPPASWEPAQLGSPDYARYLAGFIQTVGLPYLCHHHYAIRADGSLDASFLTNLEQVSRAAQRAELPFWSGLQCAAWRDLGVPGEAELQFQAFASIAYGARGLCWFAYLPQSVGGYRGGPLDALGEPTPTWHTLRGIHHRIHRMGPAHMRLRYLQTFLHPDPITPDAGLSASRYVRDIAGGSWLIGEFEAPSRQQALFVVNRDLRQAQSLRIILKAEGTLHKFDAWHGGWIPFDEPMQWLAPGEGALLVLTAPNEPVFGSTR